MALDRPLGPHLHDDQVSKTSDSAGKKPDKKPDLARLERNLGHSFADRSLLETALTHMSAESARHGGHYQRLEFLGDRVLGLSISDMLYRRYDTALEGDLSRRLADLVRKETCAEVARIWDLGPFMRLGDGEVLNGARKNVSILANACEAVIGAVFMDAGYDAARALVERGFGERLEKPPQRLRDAKSSLQEWALGKGYSAPVYVELARSGPDHAPLFRVAARIAGLTEAAAEGRSKQIAQQAAAEAFLRREGLWNEKPEETHV